MSKALVIASAVMLIVGSSYASRLEDSILTAAMRKDMVSKATPGGVIGEPGACNHQPQDYDDLLSAVVYMLGQLQERMNMCCCQLNACITNLQTFIGTDEPLTPGTLIWAGSAEGGCCQVKPYLDKAINHLNGLDKLVDNCSMDARCAIFNIKGVFALLNTYVLANGDAVLPCMGSVVDLPACPSNCVT